MEVADLVGDLLQRRVAPGGQLWLAIYNDQEIASRAWMRVKRAYNALPSWLRMPYVFVLGGAWLLWRLLRRIGLMLMANPFANALWFLGLAVGIEMIFAGWSWLALGMASKQAREMSAAA